MVPPLYQLDASIVYIQYGPTIIPVRCFHSLYPVGPPLYQLDASIVYIQLVHHYTS